MLLKVGNCIPCALGAVLGIDLLVGKLTDAGQGDRYKPPGGVRSYREVASLAGCTLSPAATWSRSEATGSWLVHTFLAGKPHCFTMAFEAAGNVQVHHAGACYQVDKEEMLGYMEKCLSVYVCVCLCLSVSVCVCIIRSLGLFASESTQAIPITGLKLALQGNLTPDPVEGGQACNPLCVARASFPAP